MVEITHNIATQANAPVVEQAQKQEPARAETARTAKRVRVTPKTETAPAKDSKSFGGLSDTEVPLEKAAASIETLLPDSFTNDTKLSIDRDEDTGLFIYRTVDRRSGEVVRQFPPEDILKYIVSVRKAEGLVVDGKA